MGESKRKNVGNNPGKVYSQAKFTHPVVVTTQAQRIKSKSYALDQPRHTVGGIAVMNQNMALSALRQQQLASPSSTDCLSSANPGLARLIMMMALPGLPQPSPPAIMLSFCCGGSISAAPCDFKICRM
jgi:hypothetical protein